MDVVRLGWRVCRRAEWRVGEVRAMDGVYGYAEDKMEMVGRRDEGARGGGGGGGAGRDSGRDSGTLRRSCDVGSELEAGVLMMNAL